MAQRHNHYEAAFEAFLRTHRAAYVAVNEQRRCLVPRGIFKDQESLKNLDFIVSPSDSISLLVDVKGRRFPSGNRHKQYWKNWTRWDDLESLARWQDRLGPGSSSLLVFSYHVVGDRAPVAEEQLFSFREQMVRIPGGSSGGLRPFRAAPFYQVANGGNARQTISRSRFSVSGFASRGWHGCCLTGLLVDWAATAERPALG